MFETDVTLHHYLDEVMDRIEEEIKEGREENERMVKPGGVMDDAQKSNVSLRNIMMFVEKGKGENDKPYWRFELQCPMGLNLKTLELVLQVPSY